MAAVKSHAVMPVGNLMMLYEHPRMVLLRWDVGSKPEPTTYTTTRPAIAMHPFYVGGAHSSLGPISTLIASICTGTINRLLCQTLVLDHTECCVLVNEILTGTHSSIISDTLILIGTRTVKGCACILVAMTQMDIHHHLARIDVNVVEGTGPLVNHGQTTRIPSLKGCLKCGAGKELEIYCCGGSGDTLEIVTPEQSLQKVGIVCCQIRLFS